MTVLLWGVLVGAVVAADQITKYLAVLYLKPVGTVQMWRDVLHLTYVENTGAAFGILKDQRWIFITLSTVSIIAMIVYLLYYRKSINRLLALAMIFIIGGGIGNMIDRVVNGYVVDFIDFTLIDFAVFNGADSFVTVGSVLVLIYVIVYWRSAGSNTENNTDVGSDNAFGTVGTESDSCCDSDRGSECGGANECQHENIEKNNNVSSDDIEMK